MQLQIITLYCLCDDFLKTQNYSDPPRTCMSRAEVMTTLLVAAELFHGHQDHARLFLQQHGYIPQMLSKSRLNRRFHQIPVAVWHTFIAWQTTHQPQTPVYIVDSCPISVCHNVRIPRCRLYPVKVPVLPNEGYRGYCASKKQYFYGVKVHLVVDAWGKPVEVRLTPGSCADLTGLKQMPLALPEGATLYGDKGYNDYAWEQFLQATQQIALVPIRKKNSKRPHAPEVETACRSVRKRVETAFSQVALRLARCIHAVTPRGFELKVLTTVLAYALA